MKFSDVFQYGVSLFFPLLLPALFIIPGILLSLPILVGTGEPVLPFLGMLAATTAFPVAIIVALYRLCSRFSGFGQRLVINYIGWVMLGGGAIYLCMAAIGGTSMAVVEGAVDQTQFRTAAFGEALNLFLFAQIVIIPLCLWGTRRTTVLFNSTRKIAPDEA